MGEASDEDIETFLAGSGRANRFLGVFSPRRMCAGDAAVLHEAIRRPCCSFIVHFDQHYVCVIKKPSHVLYLDSLGEGVRNADVRRLLLRLGLPVFVNRLTIQDDGSKRCWLFAVLFVLLFNGDDDDGGGDKGQLKLNFDAIDLLSNESTAIMYIRCMLQR